MRNDTSQPAPAAEGSANPRQAAPSLGARICSIVSGPALCALRVWTEAEWETADDNDRPGKSAHFPGLGWVGAVPIAGLN